MSVAMLQAPSRASTSSSSSFVPVSRQNTMSSLEGSRLSMARQSKRHSVTALYLSMSAKDKDLEIEDDLAKGQLMDSLFLTTLANDDNSPKSLARTESKDIFTIKEELCIRKRCPISGFAYCASHSKSNGIRGGESIYSSSHKCKLIG
jgi:hypothetical protein